MERAASSRRGRPAVSASLGTTNAELLPLAKRPNYGSEKRRRELDKKRKKEEKRQRKLEAGRPAGEPAPVPSQEPQPPA